MKFLHLQKTLQNIFYRDEFLFFVAMKKNSSSCSMVKKKNDVVYPIEDGVYGKRPYEKFRTYGFYVQLLYAMLWSVAVV